MNENLKEELLFRQGVDYDSRFDPCQILDRMQGLSRVSRNDWEGVASCQTGKIVIPPIYDHVEICRTGDAQLVMVRVMDRYGLFEAGTEKATQLLECDYAQMTIYTEGESVLFSRDGLEGVYSACQRQIIFECAYTQVCVNMNCEGIWACLPSGRYIVRRSSDGSMFTLPDAVRVYESRDRILYADARNYAHLIGKNNVIDDLGFRALCMASGGRIKMGNSRMACLHICDPTGYILNL